MFISRVRIVFCIMNGDCYEKKYSNRNTVGTITVLTYLMTMEIPSKQRRLGFGHSVVLASSFEWAPSIRMNISFQGI